MQEEFEDTKSRISQKDR